MGLAMLAATRTVEDKDLHAQHVSWDVARHADLPVFLPSPVSENLYEIISNI